LGRFEGANDLRTLSAQIEAMKFDTIVAIETRHDAPIRLGNSFAFRIVRKTG
jgi:hypothetical protein